MGNMKHLVLISLLVFCSYLEGADDYYYNYPDDDPSYDPNYEYEYVYEDSDDCLDEDSDGYCDTDDDGNVQYEEGGVELVPTFVDMVTNVKVDLGNTARLTCNVINLGSRVISWKKGDSFLFLGESSLTEDKRYSVTATSDSSTLSITLVNNQDAGDFTCQVATKEPMETKFRIEIKTPPSVKIVNKPENGKYILEEGSELKLTCEGNGDPKPSLAWKRLSSQMPPGLSVPHSDTLKFSSISESDSGTYQCVANNGFGHPVIDSVSVIVKHKPKIYVHEEFLTNKETDDIHLLKLICTVQAYPKAQTKWTRNDQSLPSSRVNHVHQDGQHIVEITRPRQSDIGVYTCEASNEMGKVFAVLNIPENEDLPDIVNDIVEAQEIVETVEENPSSASSVYLNSLLLCLVIMMIK